VNQLMTERMRLLGLWKQLFEERQQRPSLTPQPSVQSLSSKLVEHTQSERMRVVELRQQWYKEWEPQYSDVTMKLLRVLNEHVQSGVRCCNCRCQDNSQLRTHRQEG
jgi:hypothetical protein